MRVFVVGVVTLAWALASAAPAFATGKQIICLKPTSGTPIPFWGDDFDGMRLQTLLKSEEINYSGKITAVDYSRPPGPTGTFNNYKLYLCHTDKRSLSTTFADNYKGTPVKAADAKSFTVKYFEGWFSLGMANPFDYDNNYGLLIEIQWRGDNGEVIYVHNGTLGASKLRVYAFNDPEATVGKADGVPYYTRLSFNIYTASSQSSLGRVKALFR